MYQNSFFHFFLQTALETDVDILQVRTSKDAEKNNLQIVYNMEAPKAMVSELKTKLPSIISSFREFADKHHVTLSVELLKDSINQYTNEAYNAAVSYDVQMSQVSIFFRNTVVRYQEAVQTFFDTVIKVLNEIRFRLPGSDEMITLSELIKRLTNSIADLLNVTTHIIYQNLEVYFNYLVEQIGNIEIAMYDGEVIIGSQIINEVKTEVKEVFEELVEFWKDLESLEVLLGETSDTLEVIVEKTQEFVDSLKSDYLEAVLADFNENYRQAATAVRNLVDVTLSFSMEELSSVCEFIMTEIIKLIDQINRDVSGYLQQTSEEVQARLTVRDGKLEITLPLDLQH